MVTLTDEQAIACFLKKANRSFKQLLTEIEQISAELLGSIYQTDAVYSINNELKCMIASLFVLGVCSKIPNKGYNGYCCTRGCNKQITGVVMSVGRKIYFGYLIALMSIPVFTQESFDYGSALDAAVMFYDANR